MLRCLMHLAATASRRGLPGPRLAPACCGPGFACVLKPGVCPSPALPGGNPEDPAVGGVPRNALEGSPASDASSCCVLGVCHVPKGVAPPASSARPVPLPAPTRYSGSAGIRSFLQACGNTSVPWLFTDESQDLALQAWDEGSGAGKIWGKKLKCPRGVGI